jgi:hypothetical protein
VISPCQVHLAFIINSEPEEAGMKEMHRTHKEAAWGWVSALNDWRRSRTRQRLRTPSRIVTPWSR